MSNAPDQLASLQDLCEHAQVLQEGGHPYVYLSKLKIRIAEAYHIVDAILSPIPHTGYTTRLFLSQPFPSKASNWSAHQILGRAWHSWSWQGVPAELPWVQMVLCHLDALK